MTRGLHSDKADRSAPLVRTIALLGSLLVAGPAYAGGVRIVAGIPPVAGLVREVAGDDAQVEVLLKPGRSPHSFSPTLRELLALREARVLVFGGMPFERVLADRLRALAPQARVLALPVAGAHRPAGGHHAAHWWLDPLEAARATRAIGELLARVDPPQARDYRARAARLARRLERIDATLRLRLRGLEGRLVITSHGILDGVAERYGLHVQAIEHEGRPPTLRRLVVLLRRARRAGVRTIFVARGHPLRGAWVLAGELNARLVVVDPLSQDVPGTIRTLFDQIARSLDARSLAAAGRDPFSIGDRSLWP